VIETTQIERRCTRLARTLDARETDEVVLLRAARLMKHVHTDLRRALWAHTKEAGWTQEVGVAEASLRAMEGDLRHVLLGHLGLGKYQMHEHLTHALDQSFEALDLLR
jgi:hypothetical protein